MKTRKIDKHEKDNHANTKKDVSTLIVDMIAHYRVILQNLPDTFEDWIKKFLQTVHNDGKYNQIDIVADTYSNFSVKSREREKRGSSSSSKVKIAIQTTNITERRKVTEKRTMMEIMTTTMT